MSYATITPDRGDRPQFFEFCIKQLNRLNNGHPVNAYLMNDKPKNGEVDLVPRMRAGVEHARRDGFKSVYCIESDDFYPTNYFEQMGIGDYDFIGYQETIYYHLKNKTYGIWKHPNRSSLFCTAFKVAALENFKWPKDNAIFLDLEIWKFATRGRFKVKLLRNNPCLGMKHNVGLCGGKAHKWTMRNKDNDLTFLKSRVDSDAYEFYTKLMLTL